MTFNENVKLKKKRVTWKRSMATLFAFAGIVGAANLVQDCSPQKNTPAPNVSTGSCETGADANANLDCRVEFTTNSLDLVWTQLLKEKNKVYTAPEVVVFANQVQSACGLAELAVGPFYCSYDKTIYLETEFFKVLEKDYGFDNTAMAQEYVIAHEYGHAIQDRLGVLQRAFSGPIGDDSMPVRVELQADCYAGVWATKADELVDESGTPYLKPITEDQVKNAIGAASSVGDDNIQTRAGMEITPEKFSHGTSHEREQWFLAGYRTGSMNSCDTFNAADLDNPPALK